MEASHSRALWPLSCVRRGFLPVPCSGSGVHKIQLIYNLIIYNLLDFMISILLYIMYALSYSPPMTYDLGTIQITDRRHTAAESASGGTTETEETSVFLVQLLRYVITR